MSDITNLLADRVKLLKGSPILILAAKAADMKASGKNVISLSIGEPDWDTYQNIKEVAIGSIRVGMTKYTPPSGIPDLRKAVAAQATTDYGIKFESNQVTVSSGAKFILFAAFNTVLNSGDEIIIPAPYWASYTTMVEMAGGVPKCVKTEKKANLKLTPELLEKAIGPKTKALLLNSPSNPTGVVYSKEELLALAEVLRKHPKIVVISDDIYNRLVFDLPANSKVSTHLYHVAPDLRDRIISVNGASKSYAMTGWRLGWALGHPQMITAMSNYQSQTVSCANSIAQYAALEGIQNSDKDVAETVKTLKQRIDFTSAEIAKIPGIDIIKPGGAFYLWIDISSYFGKKYGDRTITTSDEVANVLLEEKHIAVVPGSEFGMEGYLRLSIAIENAKAKEAIDRMAHFFGSLK